MVHNLIKQKNSKQNILDKAICSKYQAIQHIARFFDIIPIYIKNIEALLL